jgi:hypothetical protein
VGDVAAGNFVKLLRISPGNADIFPHASSLVKVEWIVEETPVDSQFCVGCVLDCGGRFAFFKAPDVLYDPGYGFLKHSYS